MRAIGGPFLLFSSLVVVAGTLGARARAEAPSHPEPRASTSFTQLVPDAGAPFSYTVPLHYGSFADVEIGSTSSGTLRLEVEVLENSAIRDRRLWILLPGRVVLLSEVLGVENLFEIGSSLLVRVRAEAPLSAILVRRD